MFSMEMSNEQLLQRMIAMDTRIDTQRLRSGRLNHDEWDVFFQALESYDHAMIFLDDTPANHPRWRCEPNAAGFTSNTASIWSSWTTSS